MTRKFGTFFAIFLSLILIGGFCFSHYSAVKEITPVAAKFANDILVKYKNSAEPETVKIPTGISAENFAAQYAKNSDVEYAEPDYIYHTSVLPSDPDYSKQWYLDKIRAPLAWDKIRETPNVIIAVIDTGVQLNHPDLAANI